MKFADLVDYVLPEVSGCPHFTAEKAIRDACIELCEKTDVYVVGAELLQVVPGITEYDIDAPVGTEPSRVLSLLRSGSPLTKVKPIEAIERIDSTTATAPSFYSQFDNTKLILGPTPDAKETLKIVTSLKPSPTATSIPDTIGLEHRETIVSGALWRLQMMSTQTWYNPSAAQMNLLLFNRGVAKVMKRVKSGFTGASLTVRSREFI